MTLLRKARVILACVIAALVATAGPPAATSGWVYHSSYTGDVFGAAQRAAG